MLIGITGSVVAGKKTVVDILKQKGFTEAVLEIPKNKQYKTDPSGAPPLSASSAEVAADEATEEIRTRLENGSLSDQDVLVDGERVIFQSGPAMVDWITSRWQEKWVIRMSEDVVGLLDKLVRRPFFYLVAVEGPLQVRLARYLSQSSKQDLTTVDAISTFTRKDDSFAYPECAAAKAMLSGIQARLINDGTLAELEDAVGRAVAAAAAVLRPSWDDYFMKLAELASQRCNCMKRRVGCVLVRDRRVLATGYNGTPRNVVNCNEGGCGRCNSAEMRVGQGLETCLCLHAEENALLEAGRERIGTGAIMYCTTCPCLTCSVKLVQVGVAEVVYNYEYGTDAQAREFLTSAGVKFRQHIPHFGCQSFTARR